MNKVFRPLFLFAVYFFFYVPLALLILQSFNNSQFSLVWHGFTWDWYRILLRDSHLITASWHSLILAILAASIATSLALLATVALLRYRFRGHKIFNGMIFILLLVPDIVMGTALLVLFSWLNLPLGFFSLLLAHISICAPFAFVALQSRFLTLDPYLFEAAQDLGAKDSTIMRKIIIPLVWPGILSALLLSFTLSFDDLVISYFVSGPSFEILPLKIYSLVRIGIKPEVNALCTVILCITLSLVILAQRIILRKK